MQILLVSDNPLFTDVIFQLFLEKPDIVLRKADQKTLYATFDELVPDVLFVDQAIEKVNLERILELGRNLPCSKILLLSQQGNEIVVVHSQRANIGKIEDLMRIIRGDDEAFVTLGLCSY